MGNSASSECVGLEVGKEPVSDPVPTVTDSEPVEEMAADQERGNESVTPCVYVGEKPESVKLPDARSDRVVDSSLVSELDGDELAVKLCVGVS